MSRPVDNSLYKRGVVDACASLSPIIEDLFNQLKDAEENITLEFGGLSDWYRKYGKTEFKDFLEEKLTEAFLDISEWTPNDFHPFAL